MSPDRNTTTTGTATTSTVSRPALLPALKVVTVLFALLVLVQAILGGRGWFVDRDFINIHGGVGNLVILVALILVALVIIAGLRGWILSLSAATLLLTIGQYVLGLASADSAQAAAMHIPNGVLIFGLAVAQSAMILPLRR